MKVVRSDEIKVDKLAQRRTRLGKARAKAQEIVDLVAAEGDKALLDLTKRFDKTELKELRVSEEEVREAVARVPQKVKDALQVCIDNVRGFSRSQWSTPAEYRKEGIELGRIHVPLDSVGIYVPGGKASYPSTVIMASIPARSVGVKRIIICTPPDKDGKVGDVVLCAAQMCGITEVYKVGGAQAIAAMAFGTKTIPKVEKIVGPGNVYVVAAKEIVREVVGIDFSAGPSEILMIADEAANPVYIAADILAQAEHDEEAFCIVCTPSADLAGKVEAELKAQLDNCERKAIISKALEKHGHIIITKDLDEAFDISNAIAPEHLCILVRSPKKYLEKVRNAGSVFLGEYSVVAAGDYCTGPNHILPTGGQAREMSGLSADDFFRRIYYQTVSKEELGRLRKTISTMAEVEGLGAHRCSVEKRFDKGQAKKEEGGGGGGAK